MAFEVADSTSFKSCDHNTRVCYKMQCLGLSFCASPKGLRNISHIGLCYNKILIA